MQRRRFLPNPPAFHMILSTMIPFSMQSHAVPIRFDTPRFQTLFGEPA
jgi:hypothetical protein